MKPSDKNIEQKPFLYSYIQLFNGEFTNSFMIQKLLKNKKEANSPIF